MPDPMKDPAVLSVMNKIAANDEYADAWALAQGVFQDDWRPRDIYKLVAEVLAYTAGAPAQEPVAWRVVCASNIIPDGDILHPTRESAEEAAKGADSWDGCCDQPHRVEPLGVLLKKTSPEPGEQSGGEVHERCAFCVDGLVNQIEPGLPPVPCPKCCAAGALAREPVAREDREKLAREYAEAAWADCLKYAEDRGIEFSHDFGVVALERIKAAILYAAGVLLHHGAPRSTPGGEGENDE